MKPRQNSHRGPCAVMNMALVPLHLQRAELGLHRVLFNTGAWSCRGAEPELPGLLAAHEDAPVPGIVVCDSSSGSRSFLH